MAYSEKAKKLRRCKATTKAGKPCKAWAVWNPRRPEDEGRCVAHSSHQHTGPMPNPPAWATPGKDPYNGSRHLCTCEAYNWPHRPGGGVCRWPDPPLYRCTTPAGTRAWWRLGRRVVRESGG